MDPLGIRDIATYVIAPLLAVLCGLIAFIVNNGMKKVDDHIKEDHENFTALFSSQIEISNKISSGFSCVNQRINDNHIDFLQKLNEHIQKGN